MVPKRATDDDDELATVIGRYALEELTLGQAADRLDISRMEMRTILRDSVATLRLGPKSKGEILRNAERLSDG
ncbi:sigma factor-like helix-turn-helix DNA-binding protein [Haladaptatus sp.]|uniref:sigma factor-like helix-turn-helix DNA-binding protein n=1 Tax=Haladaptatus sp. TaxID=1973141 RepID=UPI003C490E62